MASLTTRFTSRRRSDAAALLLAVAVAVAACGDPPSSGGDRFDWELGPSELSEALLGVCEADDRLVAVGGARGRGLVVEYDGQRWRREVLPDGVPRLWDCWGDRDGELVAVGEDGVAVRRIDGEWGRDVDGIASNVTLFGVWGVAASDLWAVGGPPTLTSAGVIAHWDGITWGPVELPGAPGRALFDVWGSAADDVWAVGVGGAIHHYDGVRWQPIASPIGADLIALWGTGASEAFAVGGHRSGVVIEWNGRDWLPFGTAPERLSGVWTAPEQPLYAAGSAGLFHRYARAEGRPRSTRLTVARPVPELCVHSLFGRDDGEIVVAAAADLADGEPSFRGALLAHRSSLAAAVDPGRSDAGPLPDAAVRPDAAPGGVGPGEPCGSTSPCGSGLDCWRLQESAETICAQTCDSDIDCAGLGTGACCERPGFHSIDRVCIPPGRSECGDPI